MDVKAIRAKYRDDIPDLHNDAYRKVWDRAIKKRSLAAAVKSKCLDCSCWQSVEIKNCQCVACPLFEVRPYADHPKRKKTPKTPAESQS